MFGTNLNGDVVAIDGIEPVCISKIAWVGLIVVRSAGQIYVVHENILRFNHHKVPIYQRINGAI